METEEDIAAAKRAEAKRLIEHALDSLNQASLLLFRSNAPCDEATCESIAMASRELRA